MFHPVSARFFSKVKLARAIMRLLARVVGQSHLCGVVQVVSRRATVGSRIFNIGGG